MCTMLCVATWLADAAKAEEEQTCISRRKIFSSAALAASASAASKALWDRPSS